MKKKFIYILICLITSINHSFAEDDFLTENVITAKENTDYALILEFLDFKNEKIGEADGMQAFMMGQIKADGDIMLATRLTALFPVG